MKQDKRGKVRLTVQQKTDAMKMLEDGMTYKEVAKITGISYGYLTRLYRIKHGKARIQRKHVFPGIIEWMNEEKLSVEKTARKAGLHPRTFEDRLSGLSQFRYEEIRSLLAASGQDFETLFREF